MNLFKDCLLIIFYSLKFMQQAYNTIVIQIINGRL